MVQTILSPEKFSEIANSERKKIAKCQPQLTLPVHKLSRCPNQRVGKLSKLSDGVDKWERQNLALKRDRLSHHVIVVLESPHLDEYKEGRGAKTPCPANGATGRNLANYLHQLPGLEKAGDFEVVLVNAIPYMCSLGASPPGKVRDKMFRSAWGQGGESDFTGLMKAISKSGDIVVNCCTKGSRAKQGRYLRDLVAEAIQTAAGECILLQCCHPASWRGKIRTRPAG